MKTFKDYLTESVKDYKLRVKLAGLDEAPDMDKFESMFEKYGLISMSTFKKTPIQEHPQDFYNIKNSDVYIADAVFSYPVTPSELYHYIQEETDMVASQIVVINSEHPEEIAREEELAASGEEYEPVLTSDYEASDNSDMYDTTDSFLKELETRNYEFEAGKTPQAKTSNDVPVNTKPVMKDRGNHPMGKR